MSGLAGILAGHTAPDVFEWQAAFEPSDVAHTVEHAGWSFGYVDGWLAQTKTEFLDAIARALNFPAYYGRNFDALVDCLRDVGGVTDNGVVLLWDGWSTLAADDPLAFTTALSVLKERSQADEARPFAVLLRGAGPELPQVTALD